MNIPRAGANTPSRYDPILRTEGKTSVNAHDEKASTIDYLRRTAEAAESTAKQVRAIRWGLVLFVAVPLVLFLLSLLPDFFRGYNAEMSRRSQAAAYRNR